MAITWKTEKRGTFRNLVATVNGSRVVIFRPTLDATVFFVNVNGEHFDTFETTAAAKTAVAALLVASNG